MAISKEEITKLADLARIEIPEKEVESLALEMDSILDYVKTIQDFHSDDTQQKDEVNERLEVINIMREDENPSESGNYTDDVLREFPNKQNGYLKVKKIL